MGKKLRKLRKKIKLHREGTHTLVASGVALVLFNALLFEVLYHCGCTLLPFYIVLPLRGQAMRSNWDYPDCSAWPALGRKQK